MGIRIRDGDRLITTVGSYISDIRNYPAGTAVTVEQNTRDMHPNGYMLPGVMVRVRIDGDGTILHYRQGDLDRAASKRRSA